MTITSRFLSTTRAFWRAVAVFLLVASLSGVGDALSQPPMNPPSGDQRGGASGRDRRGGPGRPDRSSRRPGSDSGSQNPDPQGQTGRDGTAPGAAPPNENGDKRQEEKVVDLDKALDGALGTAPIRLNQDAFRTTDGVKLTGTYYKGRGNKDTPVVILVPGLRDGEKGYGDLGSSLASAGCAVLIPELRAAGQNRGSWNNNPPNDKPQAKNQAANQLSNFDVSAMINQDREVWFNFLFHVNDKGLCNVKKTIVVGSEFGAALACAWARDDWATRGEYGQNVVGLVLLSPDAVDGKKKSKDERDDGKKYDCLKSLEAVHKAAKGKNFGYLVIAGSNVQDKLDSAQLIQRKIGGPKDEEAKPQDKVVLFYSLPTSMQGTELFEVEALKTKDTIRQFVEKRMRELPKKRDRWAPISEDKSKETQKN